MNLEIFIKSNYEKACYTQRSIEKDEEMKSMLRGKECNVNLVRSWMRDYGLFQGITKQNREKIATKFLEVKDTLKTGGSIKEKGHLDQLYLNLFTSLYNVVPRSWMSATSKLLWCLFPDDIVIYDSFVERSLIILQCLDSDIYRFPRIGVPPKVKEKPDIKKAKDFYMNYQDIFKQIYEKNRPIVENLRQEYNEEYPHDIRIFDKLLWMMGNPKYEFTLKQ